MDKLSVTDWPTPRSPEPGAGNGAGRSRLGTMDRGIDVAESGGRAGGGYAPRVGSATHARGNRIAGRELHAAIGESA
jgi:hypothetical protein